MNRATEAEFRGKAVKAGDEVKVLDTRPTANKYLRGTFVFQALVTNDNGTKHVEVRGGSGGRSLSRSFDPERIEPKRRSKS